MERNERQLPKIVAVEIEQIERDHSDLCRVPFQFVLQNREVRSAVGSRHHDLGVNDGRARVASRYLNSSAK